MCVSGFGDDEIRNAAKKDQNKSLKIKGNFGCTMERPGVDVRRR